MPLSEQQRQLCALLGLSETLVEDAASVPTGTDSCTNCRQHPCVCTLSEFPFGLGEDIETPEEKDAKNMAANHKKAQKQVSKDLLTRHNTKPDQVTFYPSTDQPTTKAKG